MDTNSTSIHELPTDPTGGGGSNISLNINETMGGQGPPSLEGGGGISLDQTTINQIVNSLQQASVAGVTQLQSRDIPRATESVVQDPYVQQNYIPPPHVVKDYISDYQETDEIISDHNYRSNQMNDLDKLYEEIQIPLMIAILYFLFQLPAFRKIIFKYFPVLFFKDGNLNLYGFLFVSSLFGILYYLISKLAVHLT